MKTTSKLKHAGWAEALLNHLPNAVVATDANLRVTYLNDMAGHLFGLPASLATGIQLDELMLLTDETSGALVRLPYQQLLQGSNYYRSDQGLLLEVAEQQKRRVAVAVSPLRTKDSGQPGLAIEICNYDTALQSMPAAAAVNESLQQEQDMIPEFFFVKKDGSFIKVMAESILWIEAMENYAILVTEEERFVVHSTLKKLARRMADLGFIRVHRSYIVPAAKIDAIEDNRLHIGGEEIPIGKSYRSQLMEFLDFI